MLNNLSDAAALRTVGVKKGSFLDNTYRELSVAVVRSQFRSQGSVTAGCQHVAPGVWVPSCRGC